MKNKENETFYKLLEEYNATVSEYFITKKIELYYKIQEIQIKIGKLED